MMTSERLLEIEQAVEATEPWHWAMEVDAPISGNVIGVCEGAIPGEQAKKVIATVYLCRMGSGLELDLDSASELELLANAKQYIKELLVDAKKYRETLA